MSSATLLAGQTVPPTRKSHAVAKVSSTAACGYRQRETHVHSNITSHEVCDSRFCVVYERSTETVRSMAKPPVDNIEVIKSRLQKLTSKYGDDVFSTVNKDLQIDRSEKLYDKYRGTRNLCQAPPPGGDGKSSEKFAKTGSTLSYDAIRGQCKELENGFAELAALLKPPVTPKSPQAQPANSVAPAKTSQANRT